MKYLPSDHVNKVGLEKGAANYGAPVAGREEGVHIERKNKLTQFLYRDADGNGFSVEANTREEADKRIMQRDRLTSLAEAGIKFVGTDTFDNGDNHAGTPTPLLEHEGESGAVDSADLGYQSEMKTTTAKREEENALMCSVCGVELHGKEGFAKNNAMYCENCFMSSNENADAKKFKCKECGQEWDNRQDAEEHERARGNGHQFELVNDVADEAAEIARHAEGIEHEVAELVEGEAKNASQSSKCNYCHHPLNIHGGGDGGQCAVEGSEYSGGQCDCDHFEEIAKKNTDEPKKCSRCDADAIGSINGKPVCDTHADKKENLNEEKPRCPKCNHLFEWHRSKDGCDGTGRDGVLCGCMEPQPKKNSPDAVLSCPECKETDCLCETPYTKQDEKQNDVAPNRSVMRDGIAEGASRYGTKENASEKCDSCGATLKPGTKGFLCDKCYDKEVLSAKCGSCKHSRGSHDQSSNAEACGMCDCKGYKHP